MFTSYCKLLHDCVKYLLQEKSFLAKPNGENECWTLQETLESAGEIKLTDDEILPVFAHVLWTLPKFIFSGSHKKLFSVLVQAIIQVILAILMNTAIVIRP